MRLSNYFINLSNSLFGSPSEISLQQRFFNITCFFAALATLLGTIVNFTIGLNPFITISTLVMFLSFLGLFFLSKKGTSYKVLLWGFSILFYILFTLLWVTNSGSKGPTVYSFFIFIFVVNLVFGGKRIWILNASFILLLAGLFLFEEYYPNLIMGYQNETQRFNDHFFTALFLLLLLTIIVAYVVKSYYDEKENVEKQRDKIEQQNEELLITEQELERHKNNLEELVETRTKELIKANEALEEAKIKAEKSDNLKTAFLANMSHEIRTPMNAIIGFSELLQKDINPSKKSQYLQIISEKGKVLLQLINDIIDIAKIESDQMAIEMQNFNFETLINNIKITFNKKIKKSGKPIKLKVQSEDRVNHIISDEVRIEQILYNLLDNAVKYTEAGEITISYRIVESQLEVSVSDTGIGISTDKLDIIFNRFERINFGYTKQQEGTGLGLAISKKLAELLNGNLSVESQLKTGSKFMLVLPIKMLNDGGKKNVEKLDTQKAPDWSDKTFLIAEDEFVNYLLIEELLAPTKAKLILGNNGQEVINYLQKGEKVNIVLMDIQMPVMDGYQALEVIKRKFPDIPVIAQTAYAFENEVAKMKKLGFVDVILKPIEEEKLIQTISRVLT